MKVEGHREKRVQIEGWPVNVTSYRIGDTYFCEADNVSPGATLARGFGPSRDEAEKRALDRARELLGRTKRHPV